MGNRLYIAAVIAFWLASMGWLVVNRILPPFFVGDSGPTSLAYQVQPVAWRIELDDIPCGMAVLQATKSDSGVRQVHSVLKLTRMPAPDNAPLWMRPLLASLKNLSIEMRTTTTFDSLGTLASFQTKMRVNQYDTQIKLVGQIRDGKLKMRIRAGEMTHRIEKDWPSNAQLGGELTPASRLLPLWQGRRWTQEVYSPFSSPQAPLEVLEAIVTERVRLSHGDSNPDVWTVEYRTTEKTGSTDEGRLRGRLYVDEAGWILKQQAFLLGSNVTLYRDSEARSAALATELLQLDQRSALLESGAEESGEVTSPPNGELAPTQESDVL